MLAAHSCGARPRGRFVLSHWDKFVPFMQPQHRSLESNLALKLKAAAEKARHLYPHFPPRPPSPSPSALSLPVRPSSI